MSMTQILLIADDPELLFLVKQILPPSSYSITLRGRAEEVLSALRADHFDLALLDLALPGIPGVEVIDAILEIDRSTPLVIVTPDDMRETARDALRRGAHAYFTRPFHIDEMQIVIRRAVENRRMVCEIERLRRELSSTPGRDRLLGSGSAMAELFQLALEPLPLGQKVDQLERVFVIEALARARGVQAAAARLLGVSERSIWHLVKKHRIEVEKIKVRSLGS